MSAVSTPVRNSSRVMVCKCGVKARFAIAKSENNRGRLYYGCPFYKQDNACDFFCWKSSDEELYAEISGGNDEMENYKLRKQNRVLEQQLNKGKSEICTLQEENKFMRRMVLGEGVGGSGVVADGQLVFRAKDVVMEEL